MHKLQINLLGPIHFEMDGQMLVGFRSDKVRGLLAYLSVEHFRPWNREFLAELFWPNFPEEAAQSNLRNSLSNLRVVIQDAKQNPPFLIILKSMIQFNPQADVFVDVNHFMDLISNIKSEKFGTNKKFHISKLESAINLYKGPFLEGFSLDIQSFDAWILREREQNHQKFVYALSALTKTYVQQGDFLNALENCDRWIDSDPWDEEAFRINMQILLKLGKGPVALTKFDAFQIRLKEDLGINPSAETLSLVKKIQDDLTLTHLVNNSFPKSQSDDTKVDPGPVPEFLDNVVNKSSQKSTFVAREKELSQLHMWLREILNNNGRPAFITGEPGSGKTFLLKEFANQALQINPDLIVLYGQCNAYTGQGDPYFPFINIIRMLAGDLHSLMPDTIISHEHLQRIWYFLGETVAGLVDYGFELINHFFSENTDFSLVKMHNGVKFNHLQVLTNLNKTKPKKKIEFESLNDQLTQVLIRISKDHPIILVIDDLQWIDPGSISMLFHLSRNLNRKKIFLVGAYRSEEINLQDVNYDHPLVGVFQELQTEFGEILIDLINSEGEDFCRSLLDSEPNSFSNAFYKKLYQHTSGHPLFTIELLREMQIRKEIIKNNLGRWKESTQLNWQLLPAKVEAVIARRINFLPHDCQLILQCASILGEVFIVEILSMVLGKSDTEINYLVDQIICKHHRLITYVGDKKIGNQFLTFYRFRHALFQIYLYNHLSDFEKIRYHGSVCTHLESIFKNNLNQFPEMIHALARHAEIGRMTEKSVEYYMLTGKNALRLAANKEAIEHFYHALNLLKTLPESDERDRKELDLQLSLGPPLTALKGWAPPEMETAYNRAQELCLHIDDVSQIHPAIYLLATFRLGRSEHVEVDRLVSRLMEITEKNKDPALQAISSFQASPLYQGKLNEARKYLETTGKSSDLDLQRFLSERYGMAPAPIALGYLSNCLWLLGYPDQAVQINLQAQNLVELIKHQLSLCYVISRSCWLAALLKDIRLLNDQSKLLLHISQKFGFRNFELAASFFQNMLDLDNITRRKQKLEAMQYAIQSYLSTGTILNRTGFLVFLAQACLFTGEINQGLNAVKESIELGVKTGELWFQAEAWRCKGELLLIRKGNLHYEPSRLKEVEICFSNSLQIASQQNSKSFELRTAMSVYRLSLLKGNPEEEKNNLENIYNWFKEGLDTTDLIEARELLNSGSIN